MDLSSISFLYNETTKIFSIYTDGGYKNGRPATEEETVILTKHIEDTETIDLYLQRDQHEITEGDSGDHSEFAFDEDETEESTEVRIKDIVEGNSNAIPEKEQVYAASYNVEQLFDLDKFIGCLREFPNIEHFFMNYIGNKDVCPSDGFVKMLTSIPKVKSFLGIVSRCSLNGIEQCTNLVSLNIIGIRCGGDHEYDISGVEILVSLTKLKMSRLDIASCVQLATLVNLKRIDLSGNNITNIDFMHDMIELEDIDLRYNRIHDCQVIQRFSRLKTVDLSNNRLVVFPRLQSARNLRSAVYVNNHIYTTNFTYADHPLLERHHPPDIRVVPVGGYIAGYATNINPLSS
jgi:hypothetical protein